MCAHGRKGPNLTIYNPICPIQDLLLGKALTLWYVADDFKVCGEHNLHASRKIIFLKTSSYFLAWGNSLYGLYKYVYPQRVYMFVGLFGQK